MNKARKINEERRAKLREDLELQIAITKERRRIMKEEQNCQQNLAIFEPAMDKIKCKEDIENRYKEELLHQIKENKARKKC
jgi:hypothetical protein